MSEKIAIGADHAGFDLKQKVITYLRDRNLKVDDKGCYSNDRADYPDFGHLVANSLLNKENDLGILMCGSGNGIAMSANKHNGIRAALCWDKEIAALARQHNNANILVLPARYISEQTAIECIEAFLTATFEGGRHQARVEKIDIK